MEEVSGRSLGRTFEQGIYKPGHPEMDVDVSWDKGVLTIATKQTQATTDGVPACFELTLDLDLGTERRTVRVAEKQQSFAIPAATRPPFVVVDPQARILGEVRVRQPADMLREQLASSPSARGRWLDHLA